MNKYDKELQTDFLDTLSNYMEPLTDSLNKELADYYAELNKDGMNKDELLLKLIQKSNKLILKQTMDYSALFGNFNSETKKELIKMLKEKMKTKS